MRLELSRQVESDLQELADYIGQDSPANARRFIRKIYLEFDRIVAHPALYRERPSLRPGLRVAPVGKYVILFRSSRDTVRIARVIHGMRNLPTHLG